MKTKFYLIITILILIHGNILSQNNSEFDNNRLYYIYNFALNFYLSGTDFWAGEANTQKKYDISKSFIKISTEDLSDSLIFNFAHQKFDVQQVFGDRLNLFKNINLSRLYSQFAIRDTIVKNNELISKVDDENCRSIIQFSDIFKKGDKYYIILYGVSNFQKGFYPKEDITFEFEICKKNGFIAFNHYIFLLGLYGVPVTSVDRGDAVFDNYYPCDVSSRKAANIKKEINDKIHYKMDKVKTVKPKVLNKH